MNLESIKSKLQDLLSEKRLNHSIRVAETAQEIADYHGLEADKAYLAGLLHDLAREIDLDKQKEIFEKNVVNLREDEIACPGIWHAFTGAIIAKEEFGINDPEILEAIRYHSTGNKNLGVIAKIIYIADVIEPERTESGDRVAALEFIRTIVKTDLNQALVEAVKFRLQKSLHLHSAIFSRTIELQDELSESG